MKKASISSRTNRITNAQTQGGQVVMAAVLVFMTLSLVVVMGISAPIAAQIRNTAISLETRKSITTAEVLNDDAYYRLNRGMTLPSTLVLSLNNSTSTATVIDIGTTSKQILTTSISKQTTRSTKATFNFGGSAAPISYALHTGNGGFQITGGSRVIGNVFANGSVVGWGGGNVAGSVTAASPLVEALATGNTDTSAIYGSIDVGKINNIQQIGQSFSVSTTTVVTDFSFYVKKTGSPSNGTLRIYNSGGSNVGNSQQGSTGSLSAASVDSGYEWVDVYPYSPITLSAGVTYWITMESQGSSGASYYSFATNNSAFSDGTLKTRTKTGTHWDSYIDASPNTQDILFGAYTGGSTYISGNGWDTFAITGNANAGTINSTEVAGALYCQNGNMNLQACDSSLPVPTPVDLPIYTEKIANWKAQASAGTVRNSDWTINGGEAASTTGAMKINGDLNLSGGAELTLNGPLYVTGTITVGGGTTIKLASGYSTLDEFIVANHVRLTGGGSITGSGSAGSYVVVAVDGEDCPSSCGGTTYTAKTDGGTDSMVIIAPNGTLYITGGAALKAAMAKTIIMSGGSTLTFDSGLLNVTFSGNGSTIWNVESWKEIAN
jgi:hypothetical protein